MGTSKLNVLLITPKFPPQVGGAATYFDILTEQFANNRDITNQVVLTEWVRGEKLVEDFQSAKVLRLLPPRFQRRQAPKSNKVVFLLGFQLFVAVFLPLLVFYYRVGIIHTHSTLTRIGGRYENFVFETVLKFLPAKILLDIRDNRSLPRRSAFFDHAICVSETICSKFQASLPEVACTLVPIPLGGITLNKGSRKKDVSSEFIPEDMVPYLSYLGDIHEKKGVYELLDAYKSSDLFQLGYSLVFAGKNHAGKKFANSVEEVKGAVYLGAVSHNVALSIIDNSSLLVLPSKSEGMPRVCLEALSLGTPVVFPPGIPEFEECCQPWVLEEVEEHEILDKIRFSLGSNDFPEYDLAVHDPKEVADRTVNIYASLT